MKKQLATCNSPRATVIRTLRDWIQDGTLHPGDVVPAEMTICEQLKVSRGPVRGALQELTNQGLLVAQKGCRRIVATPERPVSATLSKTIVLVSGLGKEFTPDWRGHLGWLHAIEGSALQAIQRMGFHALTVHPDGLGDDAFLNISKERPAGVIIPDPYAALPEASTVAGLFADRKIPVVCNAKGKDLERFDRVVSDQAAGAAKITRGLLDRGCRRILRVWTRDPGLYWIKDRNEGFEQVLAETGGEILPPVYITGVIHKMQQHTQDTFASQARLYAGFLIEAFLRTDRRPDAVMATSDAEVPFVAAALRLLGMEPNRDVLLTGFDNMGERFPEYMAGSVRPVLTVDKNNMRIGETMVDMLRARINGELPAKPQLVLIEPELIEPAPAEPDAP